MENDVTPTRRHVVTAGAATTLGIAAAAALSACGGSGSGSGSGGSGTSSAASTGATSSAGAGGNAASGSLAQLSAVPVGGVIAAKGPDGKPILIAQPEAGKVVAFSAACTHQGCQVRPDDKKLVCACHKSRFDPFSGAVLSGPAPSPLPSVPVKVEGTDVVAG